MTHYILASDKYQFLLEGYFIFYEKYFRPHLKLDCVVLGFQQLSVEIPDYCRYVSLGIENNNWGYLLHKYFSSIKDDMFMLSFEDHYIVSDLDVKTLDEGLQLMNDAQKLYLVPTTSRHIVSSLGENLFLSRTGVNALGHTALMPSVWTKETFVSMLSSTQKSPHCFERENGHKDLRFKCIIVKNPIYPNLDAARKGKFDTSNFEAFAAGKRTWITHSQVLNKEDVSTMQLMYEKWQKNIT